ncbi:MAG TPA: DUF6119 family protein, partial [Alphaproteobacteria bacterium]|nr:DUF6119 family protein [Alphaproteobacteria bacterium]
MIRVLCLNNIKLTTIIFLLYFTYNISLVWASGKDQKNLNLSEEESRETQSLQKKMTPKGKEKTVKGPQGEEALLVRSLKKNYKKNQQSTNNSSSSLTRNETEDFNAKEENLEATRSSEPSKNESPPLIGESEGTLLERSSPPLEERDESEPSSKNTFRPYLIESYEHLEYDDQDISAYIRCALLSHPRFTYAKGCEYLLALKGAEDNLISDTVDGHEFRVALAPAVDTDGKKSEKRDGRISYSHISSYLDQSSYKTEPEEVFEKLLGLDLTNEENPYGKLLATLQELQGAESNFDFIYDILKEKGDENIEEIRKRFQEELIKIQETRNDALKELLPILLSQEEAHGKILFPYNRPNDHWLLGEIRIHKNGENYTIEIFAHNPMGKGIMKKDNFLELQEVIQKRISEEHLRMHHSEAKFLAIANALSLYKKRQQDGISCGVIVAEDLLNRITGPLESTCHPKGTLELRKLHKQTVKEVESGQERPDLSFVHRNKARLAFIKQYKDRLEEEGFFERLAYEKKGLPFIPIVQDSLNYSSEEEEEDISGEERSPSSQQTTEDFSESVQNENQESQDASEGGAPNENPPSLSSDLNDERPVEEGEKLLHPSSMTFLRKEFEDFKTALKMDKKPKICDPVDGFTLVVSQGYVGPSKPMQTVLDAFNYDYKKDLTLIPKGALLFTKTNKKRTFVLIFGNGLNLLREETLEPNFGHRMVGNLAKPGSFKSVTTEVPSPNTYHTRKTYSHPTDIKKFLAADEYVPQLPKEVVIQLEKKDSTAQKRKFHTLTGKGQYFSTRKKLRFSELPEAGDRL